MKKFDLPTQVTDIWQRLWPLVRKHHYFIFLLFLLAGLVGAMYMVSQTLNMPPDAAYLEQRKTVTLDINFNQDIIKRIETLQRPDQNNSTAVPTKPGVRTNPFAE